MLRLRLLELPQTGPFLVVTAAAATLAAMSTGGAAVTANVDARTIYCWNLELLQTPFGKMRVHLMQRTKIQSWTLQPSRIEALSMQI